MAATAALRLFSLSPPLWANSPPPWANSPPPWANSQPQMYSNSGYHPYKISEIFPFVMGVETSANKLIVLSFSMQNFGITQIRNLECQLQNLEMYTIILRKFVLNLKQDWDLMQEI